MIADEIIAAAQSAGMDPALALEVATEESGLNQNAVGSKGEIGVFQLLPSSFPGVNIYDEQTNIAIGVGYLRSMLSMFGDPVAAVAAYNAGSDRVSTVIAQYGVGNCPSGYPAWLQGLPGSTQAYVQRIFNALGSKYTVCVAGVGIPIIASASPSPSPGITTAGVPVAGPPAWAIAAAIAGLAVFWLFF